MKFKDAVVLGLLGAGCPLLLFGSFLKAQVACEIDSQRGIVYPVGQKSDAYILMVIAGIAQGAAAVQMGRKLAKREQEDEQQLALGGSPRPNRMLPAEQQDSVNFGSASIQQPLPLEPTVVTRETYQAPTEVTPDHPIAPRQVTHQSVVNAPQGDRPSSGIIKQLAATCLSNVFSAPPGVGKTTTELAWLANVFALYPDAVARIVCWKNDPWLGLNRILGAVQVLDGIDFQPLVDAVDWAFSILQYRRNLPKEQRHTYAKSPAWLVLGDYYATVNAISKNSRYKQIWEDVRTKIAAIITVGREFMVGLGVDTHSFNTNALGVSDGNIRDCLNVCALGKISRNDDGREDGGYGAIHKAIANKLIVDDDSIRAQLLHKDLPKLQQLSDQTGRPVLFTTMGHPPRLMLLDDLRQYETYQLPDQILQSVAQKLGVQFDSAPVTPSVTQQVPPEPSYDPRNSLETLYLNSPEFRNAEVTSSGNASEGRIKPSKELFLAVTRLLELGMRPSQIIKDWGYKGRNYQDGKALFEQLMQQFGSNTQADDDDQPQET